MNGDALPLVAITGVASLFRLYSLGSLPAYTNNPVPSKAGLAALGPVERVKENRVLVTEVAVE